MIVLVLVSVFCFKRRSYLFFNRICFLVSVCVQDKDENGCLSSIIADKMIEDVDLFRG